MKKLIKLKLFRVLGYYEDRPITNKYEAYVLISELKSFIEFIPNLVVIDSGGELIKYQKIITKTQEYNIVLSEKELIKILEENL